MRARERTAAAGVGPDDTGLVLEDLLSAADGGPRRVHRRRPSPLERLFWALASVPWLALVLLGSMALRVRLADGAWPVRNQPDPKDLGLHNTITLALILGSFVVVVLLPILALVAFLSGRRRIAAAPPVVAVIGFVVLGLILRADLGGLGDWIAD